MPVHDWSRVDAGLFHAFHQSWVVALCNALNKGGLPPDYFALPEQTIRGPIPDVLTLRLAPGREAPASGPPGLAAASVPPRTRLVRRSEGETYALKADRITVRRRPGRIVAVIEIVSPGNKSGANAIRTFVEKASVLIVEGVHLLVIDLFPPTKRDPFGIHKAIWDEFEEEDFALPADQTRILAAYDAGPSPTAYVEPVGVGDALPDMPLFLKPELYIPAPLETTYQTAWNDFPAALKGLLEAGGGKPGGP